MDFKSLLIRIMNLQTDFIEYWDNVIRIWMKGIGGFPQDALRGKDEYYYKDGKNALKVCVEEEQSHWFDDKSLRKLLCPIHMPEPYWGNPEECSIVIVDYNPAGGTDMNPHTYRGEGEPYPKNSMIKYVFDNSYSQLALAFPLLGTKADLEKDNDRWWLRSYGGRQWWRSKIEWMLHLIQHSSEPPKEWPEEVFLPFTIELCGWHSPNWSDNTKAISSSGDLRISVEKRFVIPLLRSIENSTCKLAVCIGAQFKPEVLKKYIGCAFNDVTENFNGLSIPGYTISYPSKGGSICVSVKTGKKDKTGKEEEKTRYYRVYDIIENGKHHVILNTFAPGGNHHPAKHFWPFEDELLKVLKRLT